MLQEALEDTCSICVGKMGNIGIVEVAGEIDIATVSLLAKAMGDAVASGDGHLILDAVKLSYIDSAGLQTLVSTQQKLKTSGREMVIVGCHGIFCRLMKITRFETQFTMFQTIDEAITHLSE